MNRFLFLLFLLLCPLGFGQIHQDSSTFRPYEHIVSFDAAISVDREANVTVTEKIKVYVTGASIRRGIFRTLPRWRNINGKKKKISYAITSVQRDDQPEQYRIERTGDDEIIYFGRKDYLLPTGTHEYELTYTTSNQIGFFEKYDEFYWNVNGTFWDFPIDEVSAVLQLPAEAKIIQQQCYTGGYRASEQNCTSTLIDDHTVQFSAKNLSRHEGLTIAVGFEKGLFTPPPPPGFWEQYGIVIVLLLAAVILCIYYIISWRRYGVDPQKPVIFPQFNVPGNLSPASLGYLQKGFYTDNLISAALVNLAVKGFVKIVEKDDRILGLFGGITYEVIKLKESETSLPTEEQQLMERLFPGEKDRVHFSGKYSSRVESAVTNFQANLHYQHDTFLREGNNSRKLIFPILIIIALTAVGLYVSFNLTYSDVHLTAGIVLSVALVFLGIVFSVYFERSSAIKVAYGLVSVAVLFLYLILLRADGTWPINIAFYATYAFIIFGFISLVLFQFLIKQPTEEKLQTLSLIDGFNMYLETAEEKLLQFHNPPKMTPEVFEKLLPYAMVLGVEKIWGDKFQAMLKHSGITEPYQTNGWFVGTSLMNMNFAHSLNSSLSQSIASSATQPSSSMSGSGGGGFSGGGGGGGGGGGW